MQPAKPALLQNFPNPFNPETWIPFHLADDADVTIRIFDIRGKQIRAIHLGQTPAGYYETRGNAAFWDGRDSYGQGVSSGIYFYNLTAGTFSATNKLTIIK
jgi:flagellar hook assembly protein FlgD